MMMMTLMFVTLISATPEPVVQAAGEAELMPIDTCVRACLACDRGNVVSCAICALCSEPAVVGSTM
jgi:hypothetical protein